MDWCESREWTPVCVIALRKLSAFNLIEALPVDKAVIYYCAGCRKRVTRMLPRRLAFYKSFCSTAGKVIRMRKLRSQSDRGAE